jgi:hypothetical protein
VLFSRLNHRSPQRSRNPLHSIHTSFSTPHPNTQIAVTPDILTIIRPAQWHGVFFLLERLSFPVCLLRLRRPRLPLPVPSSCFIKDSFPSSPTFNFEVSSRLDEVPLPVTDSEVQPLTVISTRVGSTCFIEVFQSPDSPVEVPPSESQGSRQLSCDSSASYVACDDEASGDSPKSSTISPSNCKLFKRVRFSLPLDSVTAPPPVPASAPATRPAPRRPTQLRFRVCGTAVNMRRQHRVTPSLAQCFCSPTAADS